MKWPGSNELIFSLKAFAAAMIAFGIACWLGLSRPYWSVFTVYTVMQPLSGAVRSKSWYRFVGTMIGAALTLFLIGLLVNLPAVLFLVLGAVVFGAMFVFIIDLMPRSYAFALVGLTTLVVGFTTFDQPETAFDTAIARTEEILLGVLTSVIIDSLFFPRPAGRLLNQQVDAWFAEAGDLTRAAVAPGYDPHLPQAGLTQLAIDAAALDALSAHVAYDTVPVRPDPRAVRLLHTRMLRLISLIFASGAWLETARTELPGARAEPAVAALRDWAQSLPVPKPEQTEAVRQALLALTPPEHGHTPRDAVLATIGRLLGSLVEMWDDCLLLRRAIEQAAPLPPALAQAARSESLSIPYSDKLRAALILLPVVLSFLAIFAYWSATGWDQGSTAALQTLTVALLAGISVTPVRQMRVIALFLVVGAVNTLIYQFAVLPAIADFPLLVFCLGVFLIPVGMFIPITPGSALMVVLLTLLQLGLQPEYQARFDPVLNGILAGLTAFGLASAFAWAIGVPNPAWTVRHLRRVGRAHLTAIAAGTSRPSQEVFARRALDRFAAIAAQVPALGPAEPAPRADELLGEIRVGVNMLMLRELMPALPAAAAAAIEALLAGLADQLRTLSRGGALEPDTLRRETASALREAAAAMPGAPAEQAWMSLAGTQRWLYPAAPGQALPEAIDAR